MFKTDKDTKSATRPSLDGEQPTGQGRGAGPVGGQAAAEHSAARRRRRPGRTGTRTDTVILASIDTKTGDTTLISLPRNTGRMPFPADSPLHKVLPERLHQRRRQQRRVLPQRHVRQRAAHASRRTSWARPTTSAPTRSSCRSARRSGCKVDYYVLINLQGFSQDDQRARRHHGQHQHLHPDRRQHRSAHPAEGVPQARARTSTSTDAARCGTPAGATARTTSPGWTGSAA